MHIRRTQTRNTTSGERYHSHRLVQSERVDGQVHQRTLVNLGRHFEVVQEDWPLLYSRIEAILSAQVRVTASFKRADGRTLHVHKATQPEGLHRQIGQALNLDTQPGGFIKTPH